MQLLLYKLEDLETRKNIFELERLVRKEIEVCKLIRN